MPIYPTNMEKARAAAQVRAADRAAHQDELDGQHDRVRAEAERQAREFAEAFDVPASEVVTFIMCERDR